jgi:hypothetical protein
MSHPVQKEEMEQFRAAMSTSIANLNVAKAIYSSIMLTVAAVQLPSGSGDKGYVSLTDAATLLEIANLQCVATIFDRAKLDATIARPVGIERPS